MCICMCVYDNASKQANKQKTSKIPLININCIHLGGGHCSCWLLSPTHSKLRKWHTRSYLHRHKGRTLNMKYNICLNTKNKPSTERNRNIRMFCVTYTDMDTHTLTHSLFGRHECYEFKIVVTPDVKFKNILNGCILFVCDFKAMFTLDK